jgi:hypothetical protein
MAKVAITLNDVVREHYNHVHTLFDNFLEENKGEKKLLESHDTLSLSSVYGFENETDFDETIHKEFGFEIYGSAPLIYGNAMQDLNQLYYNLVKSGHKTTVLSNERGMSIPSSLHFLSINKCIVNNYKFIYNFSKVWQMYDIIITADPFILKRKNLDNEKKKSVKIITDYNEDIPSDYEFESLEAMLDVKAFFQWLQ